MGCHLVATGGHLQGPFAVIQHVQQKEQSFSSPKACLHRTLLSQNEGGSFLNGGGGLFPRTKWQIEEKLHGEGGGARAPNPKS